MVFVNGLKEILHVRLPFEKRVVMSVLLGVSLGFGVFMSIRSIWKSLDTYFTSGSKTDLKEIICELKDVKKELTQLKYELNSIKQSSNLKKHYKDSPFFISDDDDDEYFDAFQEDTTDNVDSYQSAINNADASKLGPIVPPDILADMDDIASLALGDILLPASESKRDDVNMTFGMQAYSRCLVYKSKYNQSPEFLWRLARAIYLAYEDIPSDNDDCLSSLVEDDSTSVCSSNTLSSNDLNDCVYELQTHKRCIEVGIRAARKALRLMKQNSERMANDRAQQAQIYKWLAVLVGLASQHSAIRKQVSLGQEFKELIDAAINLDPSDALSHYLKGRWCYKIYNLTWIERQFVSKLFSTPLSTTLEEAENAFEIVHSLRPNHYAAAYLFWAKCAIQRSDYKTASKQLQTSLRLFDLNRFPPPHTDGISERQETESLYSKYKSYL